MKHYSIRPAAPPAVHTDLESYPHLVRQLLHTRGIKTVEEAQAFLAPEYERDLHDPFLMKDMGKAVERTLKALVGNEKIAVWSDYDCDGIPGGVLLHDFFKKVGANFINYIPHRHEEGYGLNISGIEELAEKKVTLMITIDC